MVDIFVSLCLIKKTINPAATMSKHYFIKSNKNYNFWREKSSAWNFEDVGWCWWKIDNLCKRWIIFTKGLTYWSILLSLLLLLQGKLFAIVADIFVSLCSRKKKLTPPQQYQNIISLNQIKITILARKIFSFNFWDVSWCWWKIDNHSKRLIIFTQGLTYWSILLSFCKLFVIVADIFVSLCLRKITINPTTPMS